MIGTASPTVSTASNTAVVNGPQGAAAVLEKAGYKRMDTPQLPKGAVPPVHWSMFASPLTRKDSHTGWTPTVPTTVLIAPVAPDVVRLRDRVFNPKSEDIDLRTAFTDTEIEYAEFRLTDMDTYAKILAETGKGGILFGAAIHNNPDSRWEYIIQSAEAAEEEVTRFARLMDLVIPSAPPPHIHANLVASLQERKDRFCYWTDLLERNIPTIRVSIRKAHLALRNYDDHTEQYGSYCTS